MTNVFKWGVRYLRESKQELEKVTWPSKKETIKYSVVVIIFAVTLAIYFAIADWILSMALEALIELVA